MRFVLVAQLALGIAAATINDSPSQAMDFAAAAPGVSRAVIEGGFAQETYWARRCGWRRCWRVWVGGYYGPPSVRDSCLLWRATHWGLRRVWVC